MKLSTPPPTARRPLPGHNRLRRAADIWRLPSVGWGAVAGLASAVFYTLTNISLRQVVAVDPFLVAAVKAAPTVITLGPLVFGLHRFNRSSQNFEPGARQLRRQKMLQFVGVALVGQVIGNGAFQIALGIIGLAASVPITLGSLLIGSAVLGRVLLGEPVSVRKACSIAVLLIAVIVLSQSRQSPGPVSSAPAHDAAVATSDWTEAAWWGAVCAAMSGGAYAFFSTKMRQTMQSGLSSIDAMWVSGIAGSTALWSIAIARGGTEQFVNLTPNQWQWMVAAGLFNFTAFVAISTALRVLPVVAVHLLNASQVAMAAVAGVFVFGEEVTGPLAIGIVLTMAGLLILAKRPEGKRQSTRGDPATGAQTGRSSVNSPPGNSDS